MHGKFRSVHPKPWRVCMAVLRIPCFSVLSHLGCLQSDYLRLRVGSSTFWNSLFGEHIFGLYYAQTSSERTVNPKPTSSKPIMRGYYDQRGLHAEEWNLEWAGAKADCLLLKPSTPRSSSPLIKQNTLTSYKNWAATEGIFFNQGGSGRYL